VDIGNAAPVVIVFVGDPVGHQYPGKEQPAVNVVSLSLWPERSRTSSAGTAPAPA